MNKNFQKSSSPPHNGKSSNPHCGCPINFGATIRVFFAGSVLRYKSSETDGGKPKILLVKDGKDEKFQIPGGKYENNIDEECLKNTLFREGCEELFEKFNLDNLKEWIGQELYNRNLNMFVGGGNYYHQFITLSGYQSFNLFVVFDIPEEVQIAELEKLEQLKKEGNIIFYDGVEANFIGSENIRDRDLHLLDGLLRMKVPVKRN